MKIGDSVKLDRESHCLACNEVLDGAANTGETHKPTPGDVTVCLYCGHLMTFDNGLNLRELTSAEMYECAGNPTILKVQATRAMVFKKRKALMGIVLAFPRHKRVRCPSSCEGCCLCEGGLFMCETCGGAEASLPTECPGSHMDGIMNDMVQQGRVDYRRGQWLFCDEVKEYH